jgi:hypothetical protein
MEQEQPQEHLPQIEFISPKEFITHFRGRVGERRIRDAIREGRIKSVTLSPKKILIPVTEIHDWLRREYQGGQ